MIKGKLSILIPYVNEWPQVAFTIQNVAEELRDRADFEIICIDNWCQEVTDQGRTPDKGHDQINSIRLPWLKAIKYDKRLSHWQAKNAGVQASEGEFLWFCDAHCIVARDALFEMFAYYREHHQELNGMIHLPLTYHILENHQLIYKAVDNLDKGWMHYSFSGYPSQAELKGMQKHPEVSEIPASFETPAMSTCGMMMTRQLYDELGGWPVTMGIYGGGENFINYVLATMGKRKFIKTGLPLHHHGDKRGYNYTYDSMVTSRATAMYMVGGMELLDKYIANTKGREAALQKIKYHVVENNYHHRQDIKSKQVMSIYDWCKLWEGKPRFVKGE